MGAGQIKRRVAQDWHGKNSHHNGNLPVARPPEIERELDRADTLPKCLRDVTIVRARPIVSLRLCGLSVNRKSIGQIVLFCIARFCLLDDAPMR